MRAHPAPSDDPGQNLSAGVVARLHTTTPISEQLLTTKQLAEIFNWDPVSVRRARARGTLPIPWIRIGARDVRYRREDIEAFIQAHRHEPAGQAAEKSPVAA